MEIEKSIPTIGDDQRRLVIPVLFKAVLALDPDGGPIDLECDDANELLLAAMMRTRIAIFKIADAEGHAKEKTMTKSQWHKHRHTIDILDKCISGLAKHMVASFKKQEAEKKPNIEIVKS